MPSIEQGQSAVPLPSVELNNGGSSTAEAQFTTSTAAGTRAAGSPLVCYLPGSSTLRYRRFVVRAGGRVQGGPAAASFTGRLYVGTSATIGSNTNIATTGSIALAANDTTWELECRLAWSVDSGQITGLQSGWVNGTAVAAAIVTATASLTTLNSENSNNGLTVTGQFSAGQATNQAWVDWFEVLPQ